LTAVPDSFVPIIKLVLNGIEIDLIFASIAGLQTIPKDLSLNDNNLLMGLDQATIRAVTGPVCGRMALNVLFFTDLYSV
jgi:poly(A) polymerase